MCHGLSCYRIRTVIRRKVLHPRMGKPSIPGESEPIPFCDWLQGIPAGTTTTKACLLRWPPLYPMKGLSVFLSFNAVRDTNLPSAGPHGAHSVSVSQVPQPISVQVFLQTAVLFGACKRGCCEDGHCAQSGKCLESFCMQARARLSAKEYPRLVACSGQR